MLPTTIQPFTLLSDQDGLPLSGLLLLPQEETTPCGILQVSHGMCEHKERYLDFLRHCTKQGYIYLIHDHRGHGESISDTIPLGYFGEDGAEALVADLHQMTEWIQTQYAGLPLYLLGHSMGSLIARCYLRQYPDILDGLILSGSPSPLPAMTRMQSILNRVIVHRGDTSHSKRIDRILYNTFQRPFRSESRSNTWICSDEAVVDAYNADPLCQFHFTLNGYAALLALLNTTYNTKDWTITQPGLPIWFFSGGDDPCRGNDTRFQQAVDRMAELGYQNVNSTLFPRMRHEILNERNKAVVYAEILETLDAWNC